MDVAGQDSGSLVITETEASPNRIDASFRFNKVAMSRQCRAAIPKMKSLDFVQLGLGLGLGLRSLK